MPPLLSIVVPLYNHADTLPALLESVEQQTFKDLEVIIVDDCSDRPCGDLLDPWRERGLDIRLLRTSSRLYTRESRLRGVEASRGTFVTCVDADDALAGSDSLETHLDLLLAEQADVLHFQIASYKDNGKVDVELFEWGKPLASRLHGRDIFRTYVDSRMKGHSICGKIVARSLWEKCMQPARSVRIRRYREDLLMCSLVLFHAENYIGSETVGYKRDFVEKSLLKSGGRAVANYAMLVELLPYLQQQGLDDETAEALASWLESDMLDNALLYAQNVQSHYGRAVPPEIVQEIEEHCDLDFFARMMITAMPVKLLRYITLKLNESMAN